MAAKTGAHKGGLESNVLSRKLSESGERDRLKQYIVTTLNQCGWREEMKKQCTEIIKAKGAENITMEDIMNELAPRGRTSVPDDLKTELFNRLRTFAEENEIDPSASTQPLSG
mmetsp:Transcript_63875/g.152336  ORF Transcript_63875/g.152336 Transcript_63875/m.152336 type:complete len:113 (-) Transcript_63875:156-494(-)